MLSRSWLWVPGLWDALTLLPAGNGAGRGHRDLTAPSRIFSSWTEATWDRGLFHHSKAFPVSKALVMWIKLWLERPWGGRAGFQIPPSTISFPHALWGDLSAKPWLFSKLNSLKALCKRKAQVQTLSKSAEEGKVTAKVQNTRRGWFTHPSCSYCGTPLPCPLARKGCPGLVHSSGHWVTTLFTLGTQLLLLPPSLACPLSRHEHGLPPLPRYYFTQFLGASATFETFSALSNMVENHQAGLNLSLLRERGEFTDSVITQPDLLGKSGWKSQTETEKPVKVCFWDLLEWECGFWGRAPGAGLLPPPSHAQGCGWRCPSAARWGLHPLGLAQRGGEQETKPCTEHKQTQWGKLSRPFLRYKKHIPSAPKPPVFSPVAVGLFSPI